MLTVCSRNVIRLAFVLINSLVRLLMRATLKLVQYLLVSLHTHYYLTVDVLYVHIFPTIPIVSSHQRSFVSHVACDVIGSCCSRSLLQCVCGQLVVLLRGCLLNRINRAVILVNRCSLWDLGLLLAHSLFATVKAHPFFFVFTTEILVMMTFALLISGVRCHRLVLAWLWMVFDRTNI